LEEVFVSANDFGHLFRVTTFGESHGTALGCVIDGCPAGINFDFQKLQTWMDRRRPGSATTSARQEPDQVEVLSGVFESKTLGTPIAMIVRNVDARSQDYSREKIKNRPGHAADLWQEKFGHSDFRGSGRASGRETVSRVMAGAVAQMFVQSEIKECQIDGVITQLGPWKGSDPAIAEGLIEAKTKGESFGGIVELSLKGLPPNLGQPVFHKLKTDLAAAMMSVGATTGVEFGEGFSSTEKLGTSFHNEEQNYGGLRGGISTGDPISMRIAFKPASTLGAMAREGRHDPAIVPRAVPVLEAMAWLVIADHLLWRRLDRAKPY
jgi:chorismate synthase